MRQTDYKLVQETNKDALEVSVTNLLRQDYRLHGSPVFSRGDAGLKIHTIYIQAMYRPFLED